MNYAAVTAAVFVITFLAELPDKSMFASLVLGTRYRPLFVWAGAAAAYVVHVAIDVTAGRVLANLLPHRVLAAVVAGLFLTGAVYLLVSSFRTGRREGTGTDRPDRQSLSSLRVAGISFALVFLAEWGDITQVTTANLSARYGDPVPVFVGATLALWTVAALAVTVAASSLNVIPMAWVRRISAAILLGFGLYSAIAAISG